MERLLISVVEGIGKHETDSEGNRVFVKDPDCLQCLKDLQRFLRNDDAQNPEVQISLGTYNIVGELLVPLILTHVHHTPIIHNALKVIALLTMQPDASSTRENEQKKVLQNVKDILISNKQVLQLAIYRFIQPLERHPNMTQDDYYTLQVSLILIRNLLAVPDEKNVVGAAGEHRTRMQEKLIEILHREKVFEILIALSQWVKQKPVSNEIITILDIVKYVFEKVDVQKMFEAQVFRSNNNQNQMQGQQQIQKRKKRGQYVARQWRYGGVFVRKSKDGRYQQVIQQTAKQKEMATKYLNTIQLQEARTEQKPNVSDEVMVKLRQFAMEYLAAGYPVLMDALFKEVNRGLGNSNLIKREHFISFYKLSAFFINFTVHLQLNRARFNQDDKIVYTKLFESSSITPIQCLSSTKVWKTAFVALQQWLFETEKKIRQVDKDWEMQRVLQIYLKNHMKLLDFVISNKPNTDQISSFREGTSKMLENDENSVLAQKQARKLQEYKMCVEMSASYLNRDDKKSGMLPVLAQCIKSYSGKFQTKQDAFDLLEMIHTVMKLYDKYEGALDVIAPNPRKKQKRDQNREDSNIEDENIENGQVPRFDSDDENDDQNDRCTYNLNQRIKQELAHPVVICFYVDVLKNYKRNPPYINHVIVQFLYRIAHKNQLNLEPMLYQLSVLILFLQILEDKTIQKNPEFFEVLQFCRNVAKNLMSCLLLPRKNEQETDQIGGLQLQFQDDEQKNDENGQNNDIQNNNDTKQEEKFEKVVRQEISQMMLIELLFWKNAKVAEDLREEYRWKSRLMSEFEPQNFSQFSSDNEINAENDQNNQIQQKNPENDDENNQQNNQIDDDLEQNLDPNQNQNGPEKWSQSLQQKILSSFDQHSGKKDWKKLILEDIGSVNLRQKDVVEFLKDHGLKKGRISREQENNLLQKFAENQMREDVLEYLAEQIPGGYDAGGVKKLLWRLGIRLKKQGQKRKRNQNAILEVCNSENELDVSEKSEDDEEQQEKSENLSEQSQNSDIQSEKSENLSEKSQNSDIQSEKSKNSENQSDNADVEDAELQSKSKKIKSIKKSKYFKQRNKNVDNQMQVGSNNDDGDDLSDNDENQIQNNQINNQNNNIYKNDSQILRLNRQNEQLDEIQEVVLPINLPQKNDDEQNVEDDELNTEINQDQIVNKRRALIESDDEFENDPQISNNLQIQKDVISSRNFQRETRMLSDQESDDL